MLKDNKAFRKGRVFTMMSALSNMIAVVSFVGIIIASAAGMFVGGKPQQ